MSITRCVCVTFSLSLVTKQLTSAGCINSLASYEYQ